MRRLIILIIALAMVTLAPATATAIDFHEEFTLHTELSFVSIADDGAELYRGWHYLFDDEGNLADDGPAHAAVYGGAGGQNYSAIITYEGTQATVIAHSRGEVVSFEGDESGFTVVYLHRETIVDAPGFTGSGIGYNTVTGTSEADTHASLDVFYVIRPAGD